MVVKAVDLNLTVASLIKQDLKTGTRLVRDKKYPDMWRLKYGDQVESDMYNLTRAKEHLRIYKQREEEDGL